MEKTTKKLINELNKLNYDNAINCLSIFCYKNGNYMSGSRNYLSGIEEIEMTIDEMKEEFDLYLDDYEVDVEESETFINVVVHLFFEED